MLFFILQENYDKKAKADRLCDMMAVALQQQPQQASCVGLSKKLDNLEMIYEEDQDMIEDCGGQDNEDFSESFQQQKQPLASSSEPQAQAPHKTHPKLGRASLMMKRSRSLPQEEFIQLKQKLQELDLIRRTDSVVSGR